MTGFDDATVPLALELLDAFATLTITREVADLAAKLRRTVRWKLPDAFHAALAIQHALKLVTRNTRDFRSGGGLEVLVPYQP